MEPLNGSLLAQCINFHGAQLQKVWETEHGDDANLSRDLNFEIHSQRLKHLTFQDRGRRLKLHQFIAKRGKVLFSKEMTTTRRRKVVSDEGAVSEENYAVMPPLETFLDVDKQSRLKYFFEVSWHWKIRVFCIYVYVIIYTY